MAILSHNKKYTLKNDTHFEEYQLAIQTKSGFFFA